MRIKVLFFCHCINRLSNVFVCFQYSYQEEQERPLRVPGTQCCKWPTKPNHSLFKQLVYAIINEKKCNDQFSCNYIAFTCVTTCGLLCVREEWVQVHGLWKINSCIRFSEESSSQDVAVLQRLAQSANPAEPAVWCRWKDSEGRRWFSLCSILWEPQRVNDGKCLFMFWHRSDHKFCFSPSTGNWSLWGDQQSRYTCSRWISQSMLYVLSHMLVILKLITLDLKWNSATFSYK